VTWLVAAKSAYLSCRIRFTWSIDLADQVTPADSASRECDHHDQHYVKMFTRGAEEAMRKLESKCSLVVPQTVPQLIYQVAESGTKFGKGRAPGTLPLNAIRKNSGGEGGIATVVVEREVRVGECWYVSCFQRGQMI